MKFFVNEYKFTPDIISESMAAWANRRFRKGYIGMGIYILLVLIVSLVKMELTYLAQAVVPILGIVLFKVNEKRAVKLEKERIKVLYKDADPSFRIEISEDIHALSDKGENCFSFSDVENMVETNHLIILFIKGNMIVTLDKRGFINNNADECIKYLKEHI